ncbi:winged helix-turn-helix transcriptional regulator [Enterobacter sp. CC120223-11]|uniref:winged helix-turn-helix transcriptional regulator n=1 Tax=Enterobacter sp. CC120223-11 TaxID=1378073 RepID=UPI000BD1A36B|nr:winged helix-turn-helix transcriptional regulator [Enterobacter sp. CC120223-11]SNY79595.1 cAMP-binding domain of CRP or a regulatory subunit of cAMP-dependent protein kinases [Enterobacter sp. CC120223-11]
MKKPFPPKDLNETSQSGVELIERITPLLTFKEYPKGSKLLHGYGEEAKSYVITEGMFSIYRDADDLMLVSMKGPALTGFSTFAFNNNATFIKTITPCKIAVLAQGEAEKIIDQHNLWKLLALHRGETLRKLFYFHTSLITPTAYEAIRIQLLLLMNEPEEYRLSIPVESYIRQKTLMSRSGIMKILSQLRQGDYINVENGKLISVNKLPDRY